MKKQFVCNSFYFDQYYPKVSPRASVNPCQSRLWLKRFVKHRNVLLDLYCHGLNTLPPPVSSQFILTVLSNAAAEKDYQLAGYIYMHLSFVIIVFIN